jgi:hypothetical protein
MSSHPINNDDLYNTGSLDSSLVVPTTILPSTAAILSMTSGNVPQPPPPPSSVYGEADEDDQHLPVDDSFHHRDSLDDNMDDYDGNRDVNEDRSNMLNNIDDAVGGGDNPFEDVGMILLQHEDQQQPVIVPTPQQPELTLKEKLVLRERQQRIETERARLKRQFALSSTNEERDNVDAVDGTINYSHNGINHSSMDLVQNDVDNENNQEFEEESTRAHPDEEDAAADEANRRLGFNMERFLRNSDNFNPEIDVSREVNATSLDHGDGATDTTKGVVMERFLNDMVENANRTGNTFMGNDSAVIQTESHSEPHRSVAFDVGDTMTVPDGPDSVLLQTLDFHQDALLASMHPSFGDESGAGISLASNASLRTEANTVRDEFFEVGGDAPLYSTSSLENMNETYRVSHDDVSSRVSDDEPRVLRLTEADMLEMAAIEEASIGNAPPSDRDDVESYSELGELTDFGGTGGGMHRFLGDSTFAGPDTPTTALESASQISQRSAHRGGVSAVSSSSATNEHTDVDIVTGQIVDMIDGIPLATADAEHYYVASASASVAANPPSEGGRDDDYDETIDIGSQLNDADIVNEGDDVNDIPFTLSVNEVPSHDPHLPETQSTNLDVTYNENEADSPPIGLTTVANRQRRYNPNDSIDGSRIEPAEQGDIVDGFDYDKDDIHSPFLDRPVRSVLSNDDSFRNLPNDPWSPSINMEISPLQVGSVLKRQMVSIEENNVAFDHSIPQPIQQDVNGSLIDVDDQGYQLETTPLLTRPNITPTVTTQRHISKSESAFSSIYRGSGGSNQSSTDSSLRSKVEAMFSDVRSDNEFDNALIRRESEAYHSRNILSRGTCFQFAFKIKYGCSLTLFVVPLYTHVSIPRPTARTTFDLDTRNPCDANDNG